MHHSHGDMDISFVVFNISSKFQITKCYLVYIYIYSGTCLIRHTKGPGKCVRLYRMSEYSSFILVNIKTLGS